MSLLSAGVYFWINYIHGNIHCNVHFKYKYISGKQTYNKLSIQNYTNLVTIS